MVQHDTTSEPCIRRLLMTADTVGGVWTYALELARDTIQKSRQITVVEGYTDVILCHQFGVTDVVACLGTALNERHIKLIRRFAETVNLLLDGDAAGLQVGVLQGCEVIGPGRRPAESCERDCRWTHSDAPFSIAHAAVVNKALSSSILKANSTCSVPC